MKRIFGHLAGALGIFAAAALIAAGGAVQPAHAQSEEISDQDKAVHYSLYYEDFKNKNFESSLPNLKWIIANAPGYPNDSDRNFERLVETYAGLSEQAESPEEKRAYLDSALVAHDQALEILPQHGVEVDESRWLIRKGRFIQENSQVLQEEVAMVPELYERAYELKPGEVNSYYLKVVIDSYVRQGDKQTAVELMDEAESRYAEDEEMMSYITEVRDNLFRSPEERMEFLEKRLDKSPDDVDLITELFDIYLRLGERDKARALGDRLSNMNPTAKTYRLLGQMHLEDGQAEEAFALYEKALELPGAESSVRREIYFNMGIAQQQMGRLANARTYFRKVLDEDANFGAALIAIGDLYATAVSNCGSFEREDRAVYWLATDYYERAKRADPSVAQAANQKINTYRRSFPDQEALFFKGWKPGNSYRIDYGCYTWIGETTTVRQP